MSAIRKPDGTLVYEQPGETDGTPDVFVSGSALPTGAATAANQAIEVAALAPAAFSTPAAVSVTAKVALTAGACIKGAWIQADFANTTNARVGDTNVSATQGLQLSPGDKHFFECTDSSAVFAIAESGTTKINILRS